MKNYRILESFKGSQTGSDGPHAFTAGTEAKLSDWLAEIALKEGWAEEIAARPAPTAEPGPAEAKAEPAAPENKALDFAPENKALGRAPANKGKK